MNSRTSLQQTDTPGLARVTRSASGPARRLTSDGGIARVIVEFAGGLGNQLFQLAAGLQLAVPRGVPIELDLHRYDTDPKRQFELANWDLPVELVDLVGPVTAMEPGKAAKLKGLLERALGRGVRVIADAGDGQLPIVSAAECVYLRGYWQDLATAQPMAACILRALLQRAALPADDRTAGISVHVRRGDYIEDPKAALKHGALPADYFQRAVRQLRLRLGDQPVCVFTDDPAWARQNLASIDNCYVREPGNAVSDLASMTKFDAHVISNSSYSWWGAFLGESRAVVAPRQWYVAEGLDAPRIFPKHWSIIDV